MKRIILAVCVAALASSAVAQVRVKGYVKRDGTYVAPYVRTAPDRSTANNWSSRPNVNPYSGQRGAVDPFKPAKPPATKFRF